MLKIERKQRAVQGGFLVYKYRLKSPMQKCMGALELVEMFRNRSPTGRRRTSVRFMFPGLMLPWNWKRKKVYVKNRGVVVRRSSC